MHIYLSIYGRVLMRRPEFVQGGYIFESRQRNATTFVVQARVHA